MPELVLFGHLPLFLADQVPLLGDAHVGPVLGANRVAAPVQKHGGFDAAEQAGVAASLAPTARRHRILHHEPVLGDGAGWVLAEGPPPTERSSAGSHCLRHHIRVARLAREEPVGLFVVEELLRCGVELQRAPGPVGDVGQVT